MKRKAIPTRVLCWICVVLAVSTCTGEMCLAQGLDEGDKPDSTKVEPPTPEIYYDVTPIAALDDSLTGGVEDGAKPGYRKWWVWAVVTVVIAVVAVALAGGDEKKAEEGLPDFPEPPER
jgi:hypothetical protein